MSSLPDQNPLVLSAEPVEASKDPALFTRERQAAFLAGLAATGIVRSAAAGAGVSHQTAYRERLASPGFRRAWDAALLAARAQAEEVLARRAFEGWEEDVVYHGEVVCTRRRYSDRLLLARRSRRAGADGLLRRRGRCWLGRLGHRRAGNRNADNLGAGRAGHRHHSSGGRLGGGIIGLLLAPGSREQQAAQGSDCGSGTHFSPLMVGAGWAV